MRSHRPPRVLIAPVEIAGHYRNLCLALRKSGTDVDLVIYRPNPAGYGDIETPPTLIRMGRRLSHGKADVLQHRFLQPISLALGYIFFSLWGLTAIFKYDVFIFGFGHSLVPFNADLPILRFLRKRVVANLYHGSEIRPPFANGALRCSRRGSGYPSVRFIRRECARLKRRARFFEKHVTTVVGSPLTSPPYLEKKFVNIFAIGIPTRFDSPASRHSPRSSSTVKILHAPSNPSAKGTAEIRSLVRELSKEGLNLELVEVIGKPNSEVLSEIEKCDFVVDQLYSDIPFPTFTIEAGMTGRASIVGGYGLGGFEKFIPGCSQLPVEICLPEELGDAIRKLALNRDYRLKLGRDSQDFLTKHWSYAAVGSRFRKVLTGEIPSTWWVEPKTISYAWGCSQPKSRTVETVRALSQKYGWRSLQVDLRPLIQRQIAEEM